ncbi:MAG: lipid biosynthesis (KDO)2-(lauroyl)-lipid acyltransferase [Verrucomicrobiaceae bacterium]|nr:lipid biosynthesis (KDO)2-(lauroyl)-lipid acyltransferase [Verrucomicrobiaceae bacterium]
MITFYRLFGRLPLPFLYAFSSVAAALLYYVARYRRAVVRDNLANALPELTDAQRLTIEKGVYRHLCDLGVELLASRTLPREVFRERITLENPELLDEFKNQQQSILFLTCHQGNWEWLSHVVNDYLGCPIDAVYKTLHNSAFDAFVLEARSRSGRPIELKTAGREILRRRREFRGFAMLADQSPFKREKRYWHDFFGRLSSFYFGPQKIAEATQYPVIYAAMTKPRRGHYRMRFEILARPPYPKGGTEILDKYIATVERAIRVQPEIWMWTNRKWKHEPPTADESDEQLDATD